MSGQELLASLAAGGPGPAAMTWAVHQGMQGAHRTTVLADGRVLRNDEPVGAVPRSPELAALRALFTALADQAGHPTPSPGPITIQPATFYWVTMILGGLMTCGVATIVMWAVMRKLPAAMDADGVTTRGAG